MALYSFHDEHRHYFVPEHRISSIEPNDRARKGVPKFCVYLTDDTAIYTDNVEILEIVPNTIGARAVEVCTVDGKVRAYSLPCAALQVMRGLPHFNNPSITVTPIAPFFMRDGCAEGHHELLLQDSNLQLFDSVGDTRELPSGVVIEH